MATCDNLLTTAIERNCENVKGFEYEAVLCNREDIDWASVVQNETYHHVYSAVPLKQGKVGIPCKQMSKGAFGGTQTAMNAGNFRNDFDETVSFKIFDSGIMAAQAATELSNATLIAIVKQKNKTADSSAIKPIYRIYGLTGEGLMATEITNEPNSDDGNIWNVTLVSKGGSQAATYLWDTSEQATEAKFAAYTAS